uniref:Unannotated protein n=1 Tax=freshwater metagenome TaxID=449393 RepID=A0A6J5ZTV4_9ZZZZ
MVSCMGKVSGLVLPGLFVLAWVFALTGQSPPGDVPGELKDVTYLRWMLYMAGWVFLSSSVMHTVFAKKMAESIGWKTNGFQYEIGFVSLGLGLGSLYASQHGKEAWIAIAIPIVSFLALAGINHVVEIVREKNFAPNNTMILVWDFGMPISIVALLLSSNTI